MIRKRFFLSVAALPLFAQVLFGQSYLPKTIVFEGSSDYTQEELLTASGIKKGAAMTLDDMNARTKTLMDSGLFQDVSFRYDGLKLSFKMIPAEVMVPILLVNLPIANGPDLDARLRTHIPLYRGKVPTTGYVLDDVKTELIAELKEKGIDAQIMTTPFTDPKRAAITAETFDMTSPEIGIGAIQMEGASSEFAPEVTKTLGRVTGDAYTTAESANQVAKALTNFYGERGYLAASFKVTQGLQPVVDGAGVHVPFAVTVTEGLRYKLTAVTLAPDMVMTQQDFDKQSGLRSGEVVSLMLLRSNWGRITQEYHNRGFMVAEVHAEPTFDRTAGTVSYAVTVVPGPVYTMGALRVAGVEGDLHDALLAAWKIPAGAVFNEGALRNMASSSKLSPELARALTVANIHSTIRMHDDRHTVDVELSLVRKP